MRFNLKNINEELKSYNLCLYYGSEEKFVEEEITPEPLPPIEDNVTDEQPPVDEQPSEGNDDIDQDPIIDDLSDEGVIVEPVEEVAEDPKEIKVVKTTKISKIPFTLNMDTCDKISIKIDPNDLPKVIVEDIKLCKDNKEYIIFDRRVVKHINDIIYNNKMFRVIEINIIG